MRGFSRERRTKPARARTLTLTVGPWHACRAWGGENPRTAPPRGPGSGGKTRGGGVSGDADLMADRCCAGRGRTCSGGSGASASGWIRGECVWVDPDSPHVAPTGSGSTSCRANWIRIHLASRQLAPDPPRRCANWPRIHLASRQLAPDAPRVAPTGPGSTSRRASWPRIHSRRASWPRIHLASRPTWPRIHLAWRPNWPRIHLARVTREGFAMIAFSPPHPTHLPLLSSSRPPAQGGAGRGFSPTQARQACQGPTVRVRVLALACLVRRSCENPRTVPPGPALNRSYLLLRLGRVRLGGSGARAFGWISATCLPRSV
jgi:hypothetical protein